MSNPRANEIIKINFRGQKLKVRVMDDGERINSYSLQTPINNVVYPRKDVEGAIIARNEKLSDDDFFSRLTSTRHDDFHPCSCVGEKTDEHGHHSRLYVEVLSKFFQPISNDVCTDRADKGKADL